jgi:hypothetical protein
LPTALWAGGVDITSTPLMGTSGGSHAAVAIATGMTFDEIAPIWQECRECPLVGSRWAAGRSGLEHIERRVHEGRMFRQRLVRVPFDFDHPSWIEDADFDLEFHVRHIALPAPGDWRQLCIEAARLISRPLDLSRPLWELYVIEG